MASGPRDTQSSIAPNDVAVFPAGSVSMPSRSTGSWGTGVGVGWGVGVGVGVGVQPAQGVGTGVGVSVGVGVGVGVQTTHGVGDGVGVTAGQGEPIGAWFTVQCRHSTVTGAQGTPQLTSRNQSTTDSPSWTQGGLNQVIVTTFGVPGAGPIDVPGPQAPGVATR